MTQIVFQPALDPFHATFRMLRLFELFRSHGPLQKDHARILDFYLLFPFRIQDIRLQKSHQKFKGLSQTYAHLLPYGGLPDSSLLFGRMEPMQLAALDTLASNGFIDLRALKTGRVIVTDRLVPREIAERVNQLNSDQEDLLNFLGVLVSEYALAGDNGLKARTGLLEYRYDAL